MNRVSLTNNAKLAISTRNVEMVVAFVALRWYQFGSRMAPWNAKVFLLTSSLPPFSLPLPCWVEICLTFLNQGRQDKTGPETYIDPAMIGVLIGMALMFVIICVVLRLFSQYEHFYSQIVVNLFSLTLCNLFWHSGLDGERIAPYSTHPIPDSWTYHFYVKVNTARSDVARVYRVQDLHVSLVWCRWGRIHRTLR